jgi:hypothetical protein
MKRGEALRSLRLPLFLNLAVSLVGSLATAPVDLATRTPPSLAESANLLAPVCERASTNRKVLTQPHLRSG